MNRKWRLYLDTSVFGGCFDAAQGWAEDSRRVIDLFLQGKALLLSSEVLRKEIAAAPPAIRNIFLSIPATAIENVSISKEADDLAHSYLQAAVIGKRWLEDSQHVAAATVARADAIVSWNFRHIVSLNRMKGYNQVNLLSGYGQIIIVSPKAVIFDE